jgi:hypothetical protein
MRWKPGEAISPDYPIKLEGRANTVEIELDAKLKPWRRRLRASTVDPLLLMG